MELILSFCVTAALILTLWYIRGMLFRPVRIGRGQRIYSLLRVSGNVPELEQTVNALLWYRNSGTIPHSVIIIDSGMSLDTRETAAKLAKAKAVILCDARELPLILASVY